MEKPGLEKTIIFLVIALIPVLGLTIIPKLLLKVFGNNIETLISDEYYTASIVAAIVIFILVLALSAYIALKPYIVWCLAYACGIIYSILSQRRFPLTGYSVLWKNRLLLLQSEPGFLREDYVTYHSPFIFQMLLQYVCSAFSFLL